MSWLKEQKTKADAEQAARDKRKAEEHEAFESRHRSCQTRAQREHQAKFTALEGKMCWQEKDGKKQKLGKFHSEISDTTIYFWADEIKLGEITYRLNESESYDNDGCSWGTGEYYETSNMWLYLPYVKKDGTKVDAQMAKYSSIATSYNGVAYDDYLGEYLLNFIQP